MGRGSGRKMMLALILAAALLLAPALASEAKEGEVQAGVHNQPTPRTSSPTPALLPPLLRHRRSQR